MTIVKNLLSEGIHNTQFYKESYRDAHFFADKFGLTLPSQHNNAVDAFRHAYTSAYAMYKYPNFVAKHFGNSYEGLEQNPINEKIMDTHNNEIGREIGENLTKNLKWLNFKNEDEIKQYIAFEVANAIKQNKLITSLDDERISKEIENIHDDSRKIYTREEIAKMSNEEFHKKNDKIMKQYKEYGVPSNKQAKAEIQKGNLIWVNSYTRQDGTEVKGYYRRI